MKKFVAFGILSLASLAMASSPAAAWWPDCLSCGCCKTCCVKVRLTQYNAFSGWCCNQQCCPINVNFCNQGTCGSPCGMNCENGSCGASCYSGCESGAVNQLPAPAGNALGNIQAPPGFMNVPASAGGMNTPSYAQPMPANQQTSFVQPVSTGAMAPMNSGYAPTMTQGYANPMMGYSMPAPGSVPYYWNAGGR